MKINKLFILLIILGITTNIKAITYELDSTFTDTISDCAGLFTDSGGEAGNYGNNQDYKATIRVEGALTIRLTVTGIELNNGDVDTVFVYDGLDDDALLFYYTDNNEPEDYDTFYFETTSNVFTIRFSSDASNDADPSFGFKIFWKGNLGSIAEVENNILCYGGTGSLKVIPGSGNAPFTYVWASDDDFNSNIANSANLLNRHADSVFYVKVTDKNGCIGVDSAFLTQPDSLSVQQIMKPVKCNGEDNGSVELLVSGGTSPYTYTWKPFYRKYNTSPNVAIPDNATMNDSLLVEGLGQLDSLVYILDSVCMDIDHTRDDNLDIFLISPSNTNIELTTDNGSSNDHYRNTCFSMSAPTLITGGSAPYTGTFKPEESFSSLYDNQSIHGKWVLQIRDDASSNTGTLKSWRMVFRVSPATKKVDSLLAGTYPVNIQDINGCSIDDTVIITETANSLSATLVVQDVSCPGYDNGKITVNATGGQAPYTYSINRDTTSQTSLVFSALPAGIYDNLVVTDTFNCKYYIPRDTVFNPVAIVISPDTVNDISCNGLSDGRIDIEVSGGQAPYTFNWSSLQTTEDLSNIPANTYTVTVTDSKNCPKQAIFTISEPDLLALVMTFTDATCHGALDGYSKAFASGGTTPYNYNWSNGASTQSVNNLPAGRHFVTVTDTMLCSIEDSIDIDEPVALFAEITLVKNLICNGSSSARVKVTGSGGTPPYTYQWNLPGRTSDTLNNLIAGTYMVTVYDDNLCEEYDTIIINNPPVLSATSVSQHTTCPGYGNGRITIIPSGGLAPYTYSINKDTTSQNSSLFSGLNPGIYKNMVVTDSLKCKYYLSNDTISDPVPIVINSDTIVNPSCNGSTNGSIDIEITGGTPPYTYNWSNSATSQDISLLDSGSYYVTVTDNRGCPKTSWFVLQDPNLLTTVMVQADLACNGSADGYGKVNVSGGTTPYSYAWSNGGLTQAVNNLLTGKHYVTVTDKNLCTTTDSVEINQPSLLVAALSVSRFITCNGSQDAIIKVAGSGGTPFYSYQWNIAGRTSDTLSNIGNGTYMVTLTDDNNCKAYDTLTLTQPAGMNASSLSQNTSCPAYSNGKLTITATGGILPYQYSIDKDTTSQSVNIFSGLTPRIYKNIVVTDSVGCKFYLANDTVFEAIALTISTDSIRDVKCNGGSDGKIYISVSGGTSPYTYSWSNSSTSQDITGLAKNAYTVTVTDSKNCSGQAYFSIDQPVVLTGIMSSGSLSCYASSDGTAKITPSGGALPYSYYWNTGQITQQISGLLSGKYYATVTDNNGCTYEDSVTVTRPPQLSSSISMVGSITCNGDFDGSIKAFGISGTPPYSYSWNLSGRTYDTLTNLPAGTYQLTLTDSRGCTSNNSYTLNEPNVITIQPSVVDTVSCYKLSDGKVTVDAVGGTPGYTYRWYSDRNYSMLLSTNKTLSKKTSSKYYTRVADQNLCYAYDSVYLPQPDSIDPNISSLLPNYNINANPIYLNAVPPGGLFIGDGVINGDSSWFYPNLAGYGSHFIHYTYTQSKTGCLFYDSVLVNIDSSGATIYNLNPIYCKYDPVVKIWGSNDQGDTGTFSGKGITPIVNTDSAWFNPSVAGEGLHVIIYTYYQGLTELNAKQTIRVDSVGTVDFGTLQTSYCEDHPLVTLNATAGLYPPGGTGSWTGPGASGFPYVGNTASFRPDVLIPGNTYNVKYNYVSPYGCSDDTTKTVIINNLPSVNFLIRSVYNVQEGPDTLQGIPSGGIFSGIGIRKNSIFYPDTAGLGVKYITYNYTDGNGCVNDTTLTTDVKTSTGTISGINPGNIYCYDEEMDTLVGLPTYGNGQPGRFSGAGLDSIGKDSVTFNPQLAGPGSHVITFTFTGTDNIVQFSISQTIVVDSVGDVQILNLSSEYCDGASDVLLTGIHPAGGSGTFRGLPSSALQDGGHIGFLKPSFLSPSDTLYPIEYVYTAPSGCKNNVTDSFKINPLPVLSFDLRATYNLQEVPDILTASPSGGSYTGPGMIGSTFYPNIAGQGTHVITYQYTDSNSCFNTITDTTKVVEAQALVHGINAGNQYCYDGSNDTLVGEQLNGIGIKGWFTGDGIIAQYNDTAIFSPRAAGHGDHLIAYKFYGKDSVIFAVNNTLNVDSIGEVDFIGFNAEQSYCIDNAPVSLFGLPPGGIFSGNGIISNKFYPDSAKAGFHSIHYLYTSSSGCKQDTFKIVSVNPLPAISFSMDTLYCSNEAPVVLSGKLNNKSLAKGDFSGTAINNGITNDGLASFDPSLAINGYNYITFSYTNDTTGCSNNYTDTTKVIVTENLTISASLKTEFCINDSTVSVQGMIGGLFNGKGKISGLGIIDSDTTDGYALFRPSLAGVNNAFIVTYQYTNSNGCQSEATKNVTVHGLTSVYLSGLNTQRAYCKNDDPVTLVGVPSGGEYTIGAASGSSLNSFNPASYSGITKINYSYTDNNGCKNVHFDSARVYPVPTVHFTISDECIADSIEFFGYINTPDSVTDWEWKFGDVQNPESNTSLRRSPSHLYTTDGTKIVSVEITTLSGCGSKADSAITLGSKPYADFTWSNECFDPNIPTSFFDKSSGGSNFSYNWNFGDLNTYNDTSHLTSPEYYYQSAQAYQVTLTIRTKNSCTDQVTKQVHVRPYISTYPYIEDFEDGTSGWVEGSADSIISWELGTPSGTVISGAASGNNAWCTDLDDNHKNNEDSWVVGPCFDLTSLEKPMIKIKIWSNTDKGYDGAVLQSSVDDGASWQNVGTLNDGINWYNEFSIDGSPGAQQQGWSGSTQTAWVEARHALDNLKDYTNVRFRIAFGSNNSSSKDGFAFDDIWIGERERIVLLEHFTNATDINSSVLNPSFNKLVNHNNKDVVDIQYHTISAGADPMYTDNPSDPGARSIFYGVQNVPYSIMDGNQFKNQTQYLISDSLKIKLRSLEDPLFNISMTTTKTTSDIVVQARLTALTALSGKNIIVHAAVIESVITSLTGNNGEKVFESVLKKMLPDAGGTSYARAWNTGEYEDVSLFWAFANVYDPSKIQVVLFVQDETTKEIYQATTDDTNTLVNNMEEEFFNISHKKQEIQVSPNPACNNVTILFNKIIEKESLITISSTTGERMQDILVLPGRASLKLDVDWLKEGMYFVQLIEKGIIIDVEKLLIIKGK